MKKYKVPRLPVSSGKCFRRRGEPGEFSHGESIKSTVARALGRKDSGTLANTNDTNDSGGPTF